MLHIPIIVLGGFVGSRAATLNQKNKKEPLEVVSEEELPAVVDTSSEVMIIAADDSVGQIDDEKDGVDHYLKVSSGSLVLAVVGTFFYTPLLVPAVGMVVYSSLPVFKSAAKSLSEGKVKASLIDSIAIVGGLVTKYYLASSVVTLVYFLAIKLMMRTEDKSKLQLGNIFGEQPRSVWIIEDGCEIEVAFESVKIGDTVMINAGELIPIDGSIIEGFASVDQQAMTGESQPVEKESGDPVLAGTVVVEGRIAIYVEKRGEDTIAAQIGEMLQNTADFRSSIEAKSMKVSDQMAMPTLVAGGATLAVLGPVSAVALMSCNFSEIIRVVAPIGVLNFLKLATDEGILIKDGRSLEVLSSVDTVVFDKTGTLTVEQPHVGGLHVWGGVDQNELLRLAAAAEYKQSHPIALAILQAADEYEIELPSIDNARYDVGYGIRVELEHKTIHVGSHRFMLMQDIPLPDDNADFQKHSNESGHSLVYVAINGISVGAVELHSTIRPEAQSVIDALHEKGIKVCIISGDQEKPTRFMAEKLGIDEYFAETLPENKAQLVTQLQDQGRSVCFVGDGINDAIALKTANVSISLQGASSAATDTAGVILMDKNLTKLPHLFKLADGLNKNMKQSMASALIPGAVGVGGVLLFHFGVYSALVLYITSLVAGTGNSMLPMLTHRKRDTEEKIDTLKKDSGE